MNYGELHVKIPALLAERGVSGDRLCKDLSISPAVFNRCCRGDFRLLDARFLCKLCTLPPRLRGRPVGVQAPGGGGALIPRRAGFHDPFHREKPPERHSRFGGFHAHRKNLLMQLSHKLKIILDNYLAL